MNKYKRIKSSINNVITVYEIYKCMNGSYEIALVGLTYMFHSHILHNPWVVNQRPSDNIDDFYSSDKINIKNTDL